MATRIIQVNYTEEFLEQFKKDGFYKQSQKRGGSTAKINEGDTVFVFQYKEDISQGEIRLRCSANKINEIISDDGELYATLTIEEIYDEGFCTYDDLLDKGLVRSRFFHWNILPDLAAFIEGKKQPFEEKEEIIEEKNEEEKKIIEEKNKAKDVKIKKASKKSKTDSVKRREKRVMAKDEKKKEVKKQPVKKNDKKKDVKKQPVKKNDKKKDVKKQPAKKDDKKKDVKKK